MVRSLDYKIIVECDVGILEIFYRIFSLICSHGWYGC